MFRTASALTLLALVAVASADAADPTPLPELVRYEGDRLTVRVTDVPLDRLVAQIGAATHVTMRGTVPARIVSYDFTAVPLSDALTNMLGAESFMLTYGSDGTLRAIDLLGRGVPGASPSPVGSPSPRAPLAEEEAQAAVLQRTVPVARPLARALGTENPPIGRVLHAVLQERRAPVRAAAREEALEAFVRDPAVEAAYLSTLVPVDDAVLANILRGSSVDGSAEEWMAALAARALSPALRAKAAAVLTTLQR